jgi:hypothetical protein
MRNHNEYDYKRVLDMLTGQYIDEAVPTDVQIASGEASPSAAGNLTLATITVLPGQECIIGAVDFGAAAASLAEVVASYTDYADISQTITRYVYLAAAGFISLDTDFSKRPFLAFYNPRIQNTNATVTFTVLNAAASTQYVANMAYVVRYSE